MLMKSNGSCRLIQCSAGRIEERMDRAAGPSVGRWSLLWTRCREPAVAHGCRLPPGTPRCRGIAIEVCAAPCAAFASAGALASFATQGQRASRRCALAAGSLAVKSLRQRAC
ncbi:hypothetical protein VPH35_043935 [Triticum aestivum]|uniref:Uncharacterized protein n=1 Tax=Triticum urartu TaxID=4572 RepID=A0A8R7TTX0_TRIUA